MMKKDLDQIMEQLNEIGELVRSYQSGLLTIDSKKVQNVLNQAYIDLDKIIKNGK